MFSSQVKCNKDELNPNKIFSVHNGACLVTKRDMYQLQSNDANYNHFNAGSDLNIIMHFTSQHIKYYMVTWHEVKCLRGKRRSLQFSTEPSIVYKRSVEVYTLQSQLSLSLSLCNIYIYTWSWKLCGTALQNLGSSSPPASILAPDLQTGSAP